MNILYYCQLFIQSVEKGLNIKKIFPLLILLILLISSCSSISQTAPQLSSDRIKSPNNCPDKPINSLAINNVHQIEIGSQPVTETGQASTDKSLGYTFIAKSGQKLSYQTNDDICIWIYTPDNQIITSKYLSKSGRYIVQVSSPQGVRNFELKMSLDSLQSSAYPSTPSSIVSVQTNSLITAHPDPVSFVRNYYISLNNRQYSQTWSYLSPQFKRISGSYSEHQRWWNSVREIKIGDIKQVYQSDDSAKVEAELWYVLNNGRSFKDTKNYIYLIWSNDLNTWLFNNKSSS